MPAICGVVSVFLVVWVPLWAMGLQGVLMGAVSYSVKLVFGAVTPSQVRHIIVPRISVNVTCQQTLFLWRTNERQKHKSMYRLPTPILRPTEIDGLIATKVSAHCDEISAGVADITAV